PQVARVADLLRPWGIRMALAIDFGSPQSLGKLPTYDPLDPAVIAWWKARADDLYTAIPDFGGFVLKADSEGRVGPSAYGRTHADAANVVARALEHTNQAIELQITQEYMGQARHTVFLPPMWKEALDFDMHAVQNGPSPVKALAAGKTFHWPLGGFVGVSNVGLNPNWYGNHL